MFRDAWTTAEPTFHRLGLGVNVFLILIDPPKLDAPPKLLRKVTDIKINLDECDYLIERTV